MPPTATIVISTFNRLPFLRRLLDALGHLDDADFELVIVNGPSTDGTMEFLADWPHPFKLVRCPDANLSRSRNLGIVEATGDILLFIDDDAVPTKSSWVRKYREFFASDTSGKWAVAGSLVVNGYTGVREFYRGSTSEYAEQSPQNGSVFRPPTGSRVVRGVMGCNCAMRTAAVREVGCFDEQLAYYLDETDLCFRLAERHYQIKFLEDNPVVHFSAAGKFRRSETRKHWAVLSRSDTYFCIKNARDPAARKVWTTLKIAGWKNFFHLLLHQRPRPRLRKYEILRFSYRSVFGMAAGLYRGFFSARSLWTQPPVAPRRVLFAQTAPARKLRIGLITRTLPGSGKYGGPGQHTESLAKGLYGLGHEIHLFCIAKNPVISYGADFHVHSLPPELDDVKFYDPGIPSTSSRLAITTAYCQLVRDLQERGQPLDFVIGCNWDLDTLGVIRAQLCPVALILVTPLAMNLQMEMWPKSSDNFLWNSLDRWQVVNAPVACVPSRALLDCYAQLLGVFSSDLANLEIVPLGIERTYLPPITRAGERHRLLFVGRLEKRKGIQTLLDVLPTVLMEFPEWECEIVGDDSLPFEDGPPIRETFRHDHRHASWMSRVRFRGYREIEDLHRHFRECDIFVVPALYESFGLAYHEAMQYGKPVIACQTGGMPETIEDRMEGLLVAPENISELEDALRRLMADSALREAMGRAGAERVRQRNNHLTFARRMEQVLLDYQQEWEGRTPVSVNAAVSTGLKR